MRTFLCLTELRASEALNLPWYMNGQSHIHVALDSLTGQGRHQKQELTSAMKCRSTSPHWDWMVMANFMTMPEYVHHAEAW